MATLYVERVNGRGAVTGSASLVFEAAEDGGLYLKLGMLRVVLTRGQRAELAAAAAPEPAAGENDDKAVLLAEWSRFANRLLELGVVNPAQAASRAEAPRPVLPDVPWDWADMPDEPDTALLAVVSVLSQAEGQIILFRTCQIFPELRGRPVAAVLAALRAAGTYDDEIDRFRADCPDLGGDGRTVFACLALLRLGRLLTRPTVRELLARTPGQAGETGGR